MMMDWKQNNNVDQEWDEVVPEIYGTYQNFISCPGYFGIHWPGC